MSTYREYKEAHDREALDIPAELEPESEQAWREVVETGQPVFSGPGSIGADTEDDAGPWFIAGYGSPCEYGDEIQEGDVIRADGFGGWEHRDCVESGQAMYETRGVIQACTKCYLTHAPGQKGCE